MATLGILGAFGQHGFLAELSDRHLMKLATVASSFETPAGGYLTRTGEAANSFFLIQSGHVEIGKRDENREFTPISTAGPGDAIGWSWILPPHQWQFDCRATEDVHGIALDARWLREQCESDHELGYHLLKHLLAVVANRLANLRNSTVDGYEGAKGGKTP